MFHAPMRRFQFELIYYFTYFSPSSHPTLVCFFPVGLSLLIQHFQQVLWVLKFLMSPGLGSWQLEFKSLIIVIVGFQNFVCGLALANDPIYKLFPSSLIWTPRSTALTKQPTKVWKPTITIISDLISNCPSQETDETSTPTRPVENVVLTKKGLQRRNTQLLNGTPVEKNR